MSDGGDHQRYWFIAAGACGAVTLAMITVAATLDSSTGHLAFADHFMIIAYVTAAGSVTSFTAAIRMRRFPLALIERKAPELPPPFKDRGDVLERGGWLSTGESLCSADGTVRCDMRRDGNLVVCFGTQTLWDSITAQTGDVNYLRFIDDGNLQLFTRDSKLLMDWAATGMGGKRLVMQDDGNLVLYADHGKVVWATDRLKDGTRYAALRPDLRAHPKRRVLGFGGIGLDRWIDV